MGQRIIFPLFVLSILCFELSARATTDSLVLLKQGTIVTLRVQEGVGSDKVAEGDVIPMILGLDVVVAGERVALTGAYAEGQIKRIVPAKSFGRGGTLEIVPLNLQLIDGQRILLGGSPKRTEGQNRKGLAWGLSIATPIVGGLFASAAGNNEAVPFMLPLAGLGTLVKGKEAQLPIDTLISAFVAKDVYVNLTP